MSETAIYRQLKRCAPRGSSDNFRVADRPSRIAELTSHGPMLRPCPGMVRLSLSLRSCFPKCTLHRIDDGLKVAQVLRKRGATGRKQVVSASWPFPNEFLLYTYVAFLLKLLQVGTHGTVGYIQSLFERSEIQRPIQVQECENAQSHRAVDNGVQTVEVNRGSHYGSLVAVVSQRRRLMRSLQQTA